MTFLADCGARLLAAAFRFFPSAPTALTLLGADIEPEQIEVPTRHGQVRCLVYRADANGGRGGVAPPVYVNFHGGAFIVRSPRQDDHACRFIAASTGAVVVNVDYDTAPKRRYPVAEEQAFDVFEWARRRGGGHGWDGRRIAVGGFSAGAKLAVNVCQQARDGGTPMPLALVCCYPALNMMLAPGDRHPLSVDGSAAPAVAPWLIRLMYGAYFVDAGRRSDTLASPALDDKLQSLPPTLLVTGARDSVGPEAERFGHALSAAGVDVVLRRFEESDHGMTHNLPLAIAREALELIALQVSRALH